ncbi:MAG: hydrolase [Rhodospirillaceae bacterium]|nr:hydrolase [Rhodospirillaceae bacterium]
MLIDSTRAALLVVDVQEKFVPAMHDADRMIAHCAKLMQAATMLGLPMVVTEQSPEKLGPTVSPLAELGPERRFPKTHFSCMGDPAISRHLTTLGRDQILICGIEAHICVLQTALHLVQRGLHPFVVADAVTSRASSNVALAFDRLRDNTVGVVSLEMVLFEALGQAGGDLFKRVTALIK